MPLGKSGKHYMNPHQMHSHGDSPDAAENASPEKENTRHEAKGDGKHHHHLTQHEDGSYTSMHTHPDGATEHAEHPHFHHAAAHMAEKFGESHDMPENEGDEKEVEGRSNYDQDDSALESLYDNE